MEKILFAASECTPFVKTGGLADVIGSLPQALQDAKLSEVRVILPLYDEISSYWKEKMERKATFNVKVGWRDQHATLYTLEHEGVLYYFIANELYFTRKGIYGYYDDGERFVFFSQAVISAFPHLDYEPNVLHGHDWQTGLVMAFAKISPPLPNLKTVFTIHNIKYQGMMPHQAFDDLFNLPMEHFSGFEWNGMINCMKSGLFHADKITTVSPSYAEEIKDPYYSEGLHPILHERDADLVGVINGINIKDYHPMKDPYIKVNYKHSRVKKKENKIFLQEEFGLPVNRDIPMYVAISRLVEQKGFHLLERILEDFLQEDVQIIILGTGEKEFEDSFSHIASRYRDKMVTLLKFDEGLARRLYAGADFFIMPSMFEPCGLSQLIALQYKTVPIVRETGGLKDTVQPFNDFTGEGNGFSFTNYNAHDLLSVLMYSLNVYHQPEHWSRLLKNVNKSQFSWKESAKAYAEIYELLVEPAMIEE
ncbi:glycogen synthase GlgA [Salipaludibacillus keqinensis]|uniref:Glycogen synthase n=1 Tax=Salipaludibacillus keqinensis TaxID=2045207 RepID=A0A323TI16_9BACI|nr:glycogen synthase GlgA [Salipaludibacillus keqinensis]PYZ93806.1 glycogen synthase GlgA [Salipaludibacillus keqinensis]